MQGKARHGRTRESYLTSVVRRESILFSNVRRIGMHSRASIVSELAARTKDYFRVRDARLVLQMI